MLRHLGRIAVCACIVVSAGCDGGKLTAPIPDPDPRRTDVTLKCLSCTTLIRLPKDRVVRVSSSGDEGSIAPSEVSSTL